MTESRRRSLLSLMALLTALVLLGLLPQSAHGMYDPKHGRWLQRDPLGYVDGMNLYEYVKSAPPRLLDPDGLVTRVQCGEKGKRPPLGAWLPGYSGTQVITHYATSDWEVPFLFWDHYRSGKGETLYFPHNSAFTQFLLDTDTMKAMEENIAAEARREGRGKLIGLKCDPPPPARDGVGEQRFCYTGREGSGTFSEGFLDWLGMGGVYIVYYADCEIKKKCCMDGRECNYARYACTVHLIITDNYAFPGQRRLQSMGTPFWWYAEYGSPTYHDWCTEGSGCREDELHPWQRR
jgi:hypothetical protein